MTDNISRMYELAGIEETPQETISQGKFPMRVNYLGYPPFTDTKQLELIKWLASTAWYSDIGFRFKNFLDSCEHKDSSQALAGFVCELWEDLSDEQKEEIKRILE